MSPQSASHGPVERGYVVISPALEMYVSGADSRWLMPQEVGCLSIFGIPSWLMPLRDRSGLSSQPLRQGTR